MSFDPYYEWLGIPPDEQPADYYRLLGVRRFETNLDVINNGAERQLLLLKSLQNGPHGPLTQPMMNEVCKARIYLLHRKKKAQYDLELKQQISEQAFVSDPLTEPFLPPLEDLPPLTSAELPPPRMGVAPALPPVSGRRVPGRASHGIDRKAIPLPIVGVVAGVVVSLLLWLIISSIWQPASDSSDQRISSSTSEEQPGNVHSGTPGSVSSAPASPPPKPPVLVSEHDELAPRQSDAHADANPNTDDSVEQRVRDEPAYGPSASAIAGDQVSQPPTPPASPEQPPTQSYTYRLRQKTKANRSAASSGVFASLPTDVDVAAALSSAHSTNILLGELPSGAASNWRIAWEDFADPERGSHFALGDVQEVNGCSQWPLIRMRQTNTSSLPDDMLSQQTPIGRVGIGPSGLELTITSSVDPDLIEHLSCCVLVIEKDSERHCIQFRRRQVGPPIALDFQRAKDELLLDAIPTDSLLTSGLVTLEVLGLELDEKRASKSSLVRIGHDEWSVNLASDLTSLALRAGRKEVIVNLAPNLISLDFAQD